MPINHGNLYKPDHCDCVINVGFDDTLPPEKRELVYITQNEWRKIYHEKRGKEPESNEELNTIEIACEAHAHLAGKPELFATVLEENQRKNYTYGHLVSMLDIEAAASGEDWLASVSPEHYSYEYDKSRMLHVKLSGRKIPVFRQHKIVSSYSEHVKTIKITANHVSELQRRVNEQFGAGKVLVH